MQMNPTSNRKHPLRDDEKSLRRRLGIPDETKRVIIFAESSHWDPSWMYTSEEYFNRFVCSNLDQAINELINEPRRVYSIECVFFLRMYWEQRPENQDTIRRLINEGRLRLTSSGVTTADTLLPDSEAILRDFLIGQEWLRSNGMTQEPLLAYFTDSFGHSPALPSLLKAAGFSMAAFTRIDGMLAPSSYHELLCRRFPLPQSSAALLMKEKRSLDFIWRGADGAEVLCHWNAFSYGQGDLLAHRGITRVYIVPIAISDRSDWNVSHKIERFTAQLSPYSRTPYLFCPIGGDFVGPLADLLALLDRYNRIHYPKTGIWAINAGLDDYLALVGCYGDLLPVVEIDPNPYWTGFYTSRPSLKKKCHELVDLLLLAEKLAILAKSPGIGQDTSKILEEDWWHAVVSNHHDYITGTAPDRVVRIEQQPALEKAIANVRATIDGLLPDSSPVRHQHPMTTPATLPEWRRYDGLVEVRTPNYVIELAENKGGAILRAWHPDTQEPLLSVSNDLVSYHDMGGLWRMGHEFYGGMFKELNRSSDRSTRLEVLERAGYLEVSCETRLDGETIRRLLWLRSDSPAIRFRVEGRAAERRTLTTRFATGLSPSKLVMDAPGGVVVRPLRRIYDPTFWSLQRFVHFQDDSTGKGAAIFLAMPGAVSCRPDGHLDIVVLRNATCERAFRFLPLLGLPAVGHEASSNAFDYALLFTDAGDWRDNRIPLIARKVFDNPCDTTPSAELRDLAASLITTNRPDVFITAVKPASRGEGLIVRLFTLTSLGLPVEIAIHGHHPKAAFLCDARENDLEPLQVKEQSVLVSMPGTIATVRVHP
jgi:hypothetical protein